MNKEKLLQTANRLLEMEQYAEAEAAYTDLILQGVEKVEVYNNRGSARFALKKIEAAIRDYTYAIRLNPRIDYPHFNRANCKLEMGDLDGAIRDYERALQFYPSHSYSHLNSAIAYQQKGKHVLALEDLEKSLELKHPASVQLYKIRSASLFALGREAEGLADLYKALEAGPKDLVLVLELLDLHIERGELKEGLSLCKKAIELFPKEAKLLLKRVELYIAADAPALAWTDLEKIPEPKTEDKFLYYVCKARILESLGRRKEAIEILEQSISLDSEQIEVCIFLASWELKNEAYEKSRAWAKKAQELDKDFAASYLLSAKANFELDKYFAAIADLELYENRGGALPEAYLMKGFALLERDNYLEAELSFKKAIKLDPQNPDAYFGRGNVHFGNSQYAKALEFYDKALKLAPGFRRVYFNKGLVLKQLGKHHAAMQAWEKAADLHHPKAEMYLRKYRKPTDA